MVTIEDEDGDEQFHETVKTSRFGVASADWDIPQKLRLGDYQVHATLKGSEDDYDAPQARATVRVSRYELPTFTVKADPDRKYYCLAKTRRLRSAQIISSGSRFGTQTSAW